MFFWWWFFLFSHSYCPFCKRAAEALSFVPEDKKVRWILWMLQNWPIIDFWADYSEYWKSRRYGSNSGLHGKDYWSQKCSTCVHWWKVFWGRRWHSKHDFLGVVDDKVIDLLTRSQQSVMGVFRFLLTQRLDVRSSVELFGEPQCTKRQVCSYPMCRHDDLILWTEWTVFTLHSNRRVIQGMKNGAVLKKVVENGKGDKLSCHFEGRLPNEMALEI